MKVLSQCLRGRSGDDYEELQFDVPAKIHTMDIPNKDPKLHHYTSLLNR
jgi:hypothetical protein